MQVEPGETAKEAEAGWGSPDLSASPTRESIAKMLLEKGSFRQSPAGSFRVNRAANEDISQQNSPPNDHNKLSNSLNNSKKAAKKKIKEDKKMKKKKWRASSDGAFPGIPLYNETEDGKNANAPFPGIPLHAMGGEMVEQVQKRNKEKEKQMKKEKKKEKELEKEREKDEGRSRRKAPSPKTEDMPFPGVPLHSDAPFPGVPLRMESPRPLRASTISTVPRPSQMDTPSSPTSAQTPAPSLTPSPVFGVSLDDVMKFEKANVKDAEEHHQKHEVPAILVILANAILQLGGANKEGLFRASGTQTEMNELEERLGKGNYDIPSTTDPHVVASLLKKWVHSLRPPLIPINYYEACLHTGSQPWQSVKLLGQLPPLHGKVIGYLISYLQNEFLLEPEVQKKTRMDLHSLATTWSPCFFETPERKIEEMVVSMKAESKFVLNLLTHMNGVLISDSSPPEHTGPGAALSLSEGDLRHDTSPREAVGVGSKLARSVSSRFKVFQESSDKKVALKRRMLEARKKNVSEAVKESKLRQGDIIVRDASNDEEDI